MKPRPKPVPKRPHPGTKPRPPLPVKPRPKEPARGPTRKQAGKKAMMRITHKNENGVATVVVDTVDGDEWSHVEISEAGRRTRQTGWPTPSTSVAS
jgi:hypothetical protein